VEASGIQTISSALGGLKMFLL